VVVVGVLVGVGVAELLRRCSCTRAPANVHSVAIPRTQHCNVLGSVRNAGANLCVTTAATATDSDCSDCDFFFFFSFFCGERQSVFSRRASAMSSRNALGGRAGLRIAREPS
jgi:hypothetical protein